MYDATGVEVRLNLPSDEAAFSKQSELSESCEGANGVLLYQVRGNDLYYYAHEGNQQGLPQGWFYIGHAAP